ncbi:MAG: S8/S53 family peptidase [Oscillospiraceae bacterium]|nr:S8/S53 family peptidase [Oscillospiraceae bacterium]
MKNRLISMVTAFTIILKLIPFSASANGHDSNVQDETGIGIAYFKEVDWRSVDFFYADNRKRMLFDTYLEMFNQEIRFVRNQLLIMAYNHVSFQQIKELTDSINAEIVGYIELTNDYQIEFSEETFEEYFEYLNYLATFEDEDDIPDIRPNPYASYLNGVIDELNQNPLIEHASLNIVLNIEDNSDSTYSELAKIEDIDPAGKNWHLASAKVFQAWDYMSKQANLQTVKLGVIDSFLGNVHPNVVFGDGRLWNKNQEPIRDYIMEYHQYEDTNVESHGVHIAGIMAGKYNATEQTAGICHKSELYGYATKRSRYYEDSLMSIMGYKYALALLVGNGVKVINISQGLERAGGESLRNGAKTLELFLNKLIEEKGYNFVIVTSAGNNNGVLAENISFFNQIDPDSTAGKHIIVVGRINKDGKYNPTSSFGERVDVLAPGHDIYSTVAGNQYYVASGASQAAAIVSGIAGMIYSVNPSLKGYTVKALITSTAVTGKVGSVPDDTTDRLVNAQAAVEAADNSQLRILLMANSMRKFRQLHG